MGDGVWTGQWMGKGHKTKVMKFMNESGNRVAFHPPSLPPRAVRVGRDKFGAVARPGTRSLWTWVQVGMPGSFVLPPVSLSPSLPPAHA